jgi:hypothetical protein
MRTYLLAANPIWAEGEPVRREVLEFKQPDADRAVVAVVPDSVALDVLDAIRKAYRDGREDLAGECADKPAAPAGHYHDPSGKYDYCRDPACPRRSQA